MQGGREVKMPFWKDLTAARQLLSDAASLTVNKITSDQDIARLHNDAQVWSVNHLAERRVALSEPDWPPSQPLGWRGAIPLGSGSFCCAVLKIGLLFRLGQSVRGKHANFSNNLTDTIYGLRSELRDDAGRDIETRNEKNRQISNRDAGRFFGSR